MKWTTLHPDSHCTWLVPENGDAFKAFVRICDRDCKGEAPTGHNAIFRSFSNGAKSNRDQVVYDFDSRQLEDRVKRFIEDYNAEVDRYKRSDRGADIDDFVRYEKIKWSDTLKSNVLRERDIEFQPANIRKALFRPFCKRSLYFDPMLMERRYHLPQFFPAQTERAARSKYGQNRAITVSDIGYRAGTPSVMMSESIMDIHLCASVDAHQCFPFYVYDEDGSNRRENITDWALNQFREHYADAKIGKWDIFHYIYGLLHHPGYRTKFADNLKRELPRIPFAPDFQAFAAAGQELARLHLDYEKIEAYPLTFQETEDVPLSYRVEDKMRLGAGKMELHVNKSLTLAGIPPETFAYRLGNRSALEWVIDQYQVHTDKRSGVRSDPNRPDDEEYIVRLVGQVVRVSLETVRIVAGLPEGYAD